MITIDGFPIDAALSETHTYECDVTSYPVESGATITDNVRPKPITVEIEGIVSDSPLGEVALHRFTRSQITQQRFPVAYVPRIDALERMIGIRDSREPVVIETTLKVYQNMVMTSFATTVDKATGFSLKFTASFTQIVIVTNQRTRIRVSSPGVPNTKTKTSGPPVVVVNRPAVDDQNITTLSGRPATWNEERGRYEYAADEGSDSGSPVPSRDLGDYTQYNNKATPVPAGGLTPDPSELGPDGKPVNSTYLDQQDGEWKNTDGTPVTQRQLKSHNLTTSGGGVDTPWYQEQGKGGVPAPKGNFDPITKGEFAPFGPNGPHPFGGS